MKIAFIELSGFRGFRNQTRFEFSDGFSVLTGRNGAGKSTVLDAVDYLLTGTINKYPVTNAKGGGLDDHIWWVGPSGPQEHYVAVGFVDGNGTLTVFKRSRFKGAEPSQLQLAQALCSGTSATSAFLMTLMKTSLIRDETIAGLSVDSTGQARFGELRAALGEIAIAGWEARLKAMKEFATASKAAQEVKLRATRDARARTLAALGEARGLAIRQHGMAEAEAVISRILPNLGEVGRDRTVRLKTEVAARRNRLAQMQRVIDGVKAVTDSATTIRLRTSGPEMASLEQRLLAARRIHAAAKSALAEAEEREATERKSDELAAQTAALLKHGRTVGLHDGRCPLCQAERTSDEFSQALAGLEAALKARGSQLLVAAEATRMAKEALDVAARSVAEAEEMISSLNLQLARLKGDEAALKREAESLGLEWPDSVEGWMPPALARLADEIAQIEQALLSIESSTAQDRVIELEAVAEKQELQLQEEAGELTIRDEIVSAVARVDKLSIEVRNQVLEEQFDTVLPVLQELYLRLRPHAEWQDIAINFGGQVRASLNLAVGDGHNPQFLFSSGQRRAAGLAFLLALHLSRPWCRLQSLLLDDPVQHIDDYRALNLVEVLAAVRQTGRQIIVAVEDVALADLLCRRLSVGGSGGRRFEIGVGADGSSRVEATVDVPPLPINAMFPVSA